VSETLVDLAARYGFPAIVCAWLLYERASAMSQLKAAIDANTAVTRELIVIIKK